MAAYAPQQYSSPEQQQYQSYSPQPEAHHQQPYQQPQNPMHQPQSTYQPPQQMSEKPQQPSGGAHNHSHAPSKFGKNWTFGLFDCCSPFGTCCLGFWCPCVLFGKTYDREHGKPDSSGCGAMCCAWYCAASLGFNSCLQCVMRGQQRERHGIEGSTFGDFCASCWCACCTLIQEEKESIVRINGIDPKTNVAYQPINGKMDYAPS